MWLMVFIKVYMFVLWRVFMRVVEIGDFGYINVVGWCGLVWLRVSSFLSWWIWFSLLKLNYEDLMGIVFGWLLMREVVGKDECL